MEGKWSVWKSLPFVSVFPFLLGSREVSLSDVCSCGIGEDRREDRTSFSSF